MKMRQFFSAAALSVAVSFFAGVAFGDVVKARTSFYAKAFPSFNRGNAVDYRLAADQDRFDKAPGKVKWIAVTPYRNDSRHMFIDIETDGGKIVSLVKRVMGHAPVKIDEAEFAKLRLDRAMLVARATTDEMSPVVTFYPIVGKENASPEYPNPYFLNVNPFGFLAGELGGAFGYFGVSTKRLAYRVVYTTEDGERVEAGVMSGTGDRANDDVLKSLREALGKRDPKRKGQISNRDATDFHFASKITFEPVDAKAGK